MQEMYGVEFLYHYQSTTTDCLTSRQTKGYMTVTLHFINAQWQLRSRVLSTCTCTTLVEGSDDAQNLAPGMQKVFQARSISEKVKTITSDNSPNVKAAVRDVSCLEKSSLAKSKTNHPVPGGLQTSMCLPALTSCH